MSDFFKFLGGSSHNNFYMRDFKNAHQFQPSVNPVRQKFNGYVNFILNRELFSYLYGANDNYRNGISSMVRTADLPGVRFKTDTLNQYNKKKIVQTGVEYDPVNISVYDTVGNEWLTMLMNYFSYHYMNPRNKTHSSLKREINADKPTQGGTDVVGSKFGKNGTDDFDSNAYGFNTNVIGNYFERIDYVLYHGNKGVQYSIINPVLTGFKAGQIDYSSSDPLDFQLTFEYESFTINKDVNFDLSVTDNDRFENVSEFKSKVFQDDGGAINDIALKEREIEFLGSSRSKNNRSGQINTQQYNTLLSEVRENAEAVSNTVPTYDPAVMSFASPAESSFGGDLISNVLDSGLSALISGGNVKDAVVKSATGTVIDYVQEARQNKWSTDD